ncbi:MAG: hypothetical protein BWK80_55170 [Desulfobacteraceae bacterium IS3]|nr:MAG: hypothetical protein BWK80_55170 [Desulfobacteraceae bacterium IS3]
MRDKPAKFNGSSYVDIPHTAAFNLQNLTIASWVYDDVVSDNPQFILNKGRFNGDWSTNNQRQYTLCSYRTDSASSVKPNSQFDIFDTDLKWDSLYSSSQAITGKWKHLVATYDGQKMKLFIDGVLNSEKTIAVTLFSPTSPQSMTIGAGINVDNGSYGNSVYYFNGLIDELRIYNRALTEAEITQLYTSSSQPSGGFVTRTLPSCYIAGTKLTVTLKATPALNTGSYAVEETPPAGWTVSNISDGTLYSGVVKFGPFFDNVSRTLTYDVTPPASETGDKTFTGTASENGVSKTIAGQTVISTCPLYHPADMNKDFVISMDELTAYGAAWKKGTAWSIAPAVIPLDYVIRAATIWKKGGKYKTDFVAGTYPLCWVSVTGRSARTARDGASSAVMDLPEIYKVGKAFTVSVAVTPASGVDAYGVEDQIPPGWTASGMNEGGAPEGLKVKFGFFMDDKPRTLTYQVTPPADAKGAYTFSGTASFDGTDSPAITGDSIVKSPMPGDVNGDTKTDLADAVIALQIAVADPPQDEEVFPAADVNSDGKIGTEEAVFALESAAELR